MAARRTPAKQTAAPAEETVEVPNPIDPAAESANGNGTDPMPTVLVDRGTPPGLLPYESIHVLMGKILSELPAIGKNQENTQQHFMFRGIDDVMNKLNPIMSKYGVFVVPHDVLELEHEQRTSKGGGAMYAAFLTMKYRWYGPRGDWVDTVGIGEGTDSLDKASPKAMTGAFKYMIFETLAISTKEAADADSDKTSPPETIHATLHGLLQRLEQLPDKWRDTVLNFAWDKVWNKDGDVPVVSDLTALPEGWWTPLEKWVSNAEGRAAAEAQDADAEQPQAPNPPPPPETGEPVATPAATPPTPAEPAPEPEPAPTPEPTATAEPPQIDLDGLTWDEVTAMNKKTVETYLYGDPPLGVGAWKDGKRHDLGELHRSLWFALGGTFEDDPEGTKYPCPFCNQFEFDSQDELFEHMEMVHGESESAEDQDAIDEATSEAMDEAPTEDPLGNLAEEAVNAGTLEVVQDELKKLKGANARAYADFRRKKEYPADPAKYTQAQALDLLDFLDKLPA